jgi:hypothetical protein
MKFCRVSLFLFLNIFSAMCATIFFLPKTWAIPSPANYDIGRIVILPHYNILIIVSVLAAAALLALAITSLRVKDVPFRVALWLLPLVLFPASLARATFANLAPWETMGRAQDHFGNTYYFLESSFLQGDTLAVARHQSHSFFKDEYEVLVTTNGDWPRNYLDIVRPVNVPNGYGTILISKNTWLVGLRSDNEMYLAYNLTSKTAYAGPRLYTLSPFLLIDEQTEMNPTDVQQVLKRGVGNATGQARLLPIMADYRHPNPKVAILAQAMAPNTPRTNGSSDEPQKLANTY